MLLIPVPYLDSTTKHTIGQYAGLNLLVSYRGQDRHTEASSHGSFIRYKQLVRNMPRLGGDTASW
jgi:hypothetical protein